MTVHQCTTLALLCSGLDGPESRINWRSWRPCLPRGPNAMTRTATLWRAANSPAYVHNKAPCIDSLVCL